MWQWQQRAQGEGDEGTSNFQCKKWSCVAVTATSGEEVERIWLSPQLGCSSGGNDTARQSAPMSTVLQELLFRIKYPLHSPRCETLLTHICSP